MEQRRIAFIGLESHSIQACVSMLGIISNMASVQWTQSDPDSADVLMVAVDHREQVAGDKPQVLVYRGDQNRPAAPYSLSQPFRAMPLISLLEEIDQRHFSSASPASANDPVKQPNKQDLALWQSLSDIMGDEQLLPGVLPLESDIGTFYIEPRSRTFFADDTLLERLANYPVRFRQLLTRIATPPSGLAQRPIFMLGWHMTAPVKQLLPWLDSNASFQLKRWPYLGSLPKSRERLTLCALLSKKSLSRQQLCQLAQCGEEALDRFLNASAISGLLRIDKQQVAVMLPTNPGRFGGLIRGLRSRLGIGA